MTDIPIHQQVFGAGRAPEADGRFLRRILFGLILATVFSGAVTVALSQYELDEGIRIASAHGPA